MIIKGKFYLKSGSVVEDKMESTSLEKAKDYVKTKMRDDYDGELVFGNTLLSITTIEAVTFTSC